MGLFAGDIQADPNLIASFNRVAKGPQNDIQSLYSRIRGNFKSDSAARGTRPGSYFNDRIGTAENLSNEGLKGSLEGVLGDTTYKNFAANRGYNENSVLAQQIGALNKPNTLQEVLGALGAAGRVGGGLYGAYKGAPRSSPSLPPDYGTATDPYGSNPFAYKAPYDYQANWR